MRDSNDKKVAVDDLRERMNRVGQKPRAASGKAAKTTSSASSIRLDHSRLMKIETDNSIVEQIAMADVITARTHSNEREECLFKRSKAEMKAPGLPYNIQTLQFSVPNVKDLRYLTQVIERLKQGDSRGRHISESYSLSSRTATSEPEPNRKAGRKTVLVRRGE